MVEYYVLGTMEDAFLGSNSMQITLNALADEGWYVVCYCPAGLILEREKPDESKELAEEILRRQFTFSWDTEVLDEAV